jgi:subtilisin family serine protease
MNRRFLTALGATMVLVAGMLPSAALAADPDLDPVSSAELARIAEKNDQALYIVRLNRMPVSSYRGGIAGHPATSPRGKGHIKTASAAVQKYVKFLNAEQAKVLKSLSAKTKKTYKTLYNYRYSFPGFAVRLTGREAALLRATRGVFSVRKSEMRQIHTDNSPDFLGLTAPSVGLWNRLGGQGRAGNGVIVGVIDTGIWPEHPSFSDRTLNRAGQSRVVYRRPAGWGGKCQAGEEFRPSMCNNKLIGARFYVAGFGAGQVWEGDYLSPRDGDGHGTHTASTAAGNANIDPSIAGNDLNVGVISGIAPRAWVAMYKACWNSDDQGNGGCAGADLVAAIDQAVADGVDVINYSIGSDSAVILTDDEISFLFAADAGVFASVSAGNAGPGPNTVGSPAVVPWVTTVGASQQDRSFLANANLTSTGGPGLSVTGASVTNAVGPAGLVDAENVPGAGQTAEDAELCLGGSLDPAQVSGKIVLCLRGVSARVQKSQEVARAGGVGMILYNPSDAQELNTDNHYVPTVHVNLTNGTAVKDYIAAQTGEQASLTRGVATDTPLTGDVMAAFSSRGRDRAAPDIIKPDVTAPGVQILAGASPTGPLGLPGQLFQAIAGTSMSAPHVAGLGALLHQAHPTWTPEQIKSALVVTGKTTVKKENGTTPADPFDMGGGRVNPNSAVDAGLTFKADFFDYLEFLCGNGNGCFGGVSPVDPSDLNQPSIGIAALAGSQSVVRTATSVDATTKTWTSSVEGLTGIAVIELPASFTIAAGASQTWNVRFTRTDAAPLNAWTFGAIVWTDGTRTVRLPVAVQPVTLSAPATFTASAAADSGTLNWNVQTGYNGTLDAQGFGLVADAPTAGLFVEQDPDQDISTGTFTDGVVVKDFELAADGKLYTAALFNSTTETGADLDLYLFADLNGDGTFAFPGELIRASGGGDSNETVELQRPLRLNTNGTVRTYRLVVHGWGTGGDGSAFTLHEWTLPTPPAPDPSTLAARAGTGDPYPVTIGATVQITADYAGITGPGTQYRGTVEYFNQAAARIGTTVVILNR